MRYLALLIFLFLSGFSVLLVSSNFGSDNSYGKMLDFANVSFTNPYTSNISIDYLRSMEVISSDIHIEEELTPGSNYKRFIASYVSQGNKIFGLLTIPNEETPQNGYSAIVFNHGYIPPNQYVTTEKYVAYVDTLARNGFVVFKIDLRGHGNSEGQATGTYFSPAYTLDAIAAAKSLQNFENVNSEKIGMWGHSMAGNLVLRAMLVEEDIKAAVIWAGAVYSYEDFGKYGLNDTSYRGRSAQPRRENSTTDDPVRNLRTSPEEIDFGQEPWASISLTQNIKYLNSPVQLHHSVDDSVVNVGYSRDLARVLEENNKTYSIYEYPSGGHNINSPYFEVAMQRTVEFFEEYL